MLQITKKDQYVCFEPEIDVLDELTCKEIEKKTVGYFREGYTNFMIDLENVEELSDDFLSLVEKLHKFTTKEEGLLVLTTANDGFCEELESLKIEDLLILPTKEEGQEAIYLHDLENDFMNEDDEDELDADSNDYPDYN
jgi:anti-sigma B factor antagonist